jgi:hypothetical protein
MTTDYERLRESSSPTAAVAFLKKLDYFASHLVYQQATE